MIRNWYPKHASLRRFLPEGTVKDGREGSRIGIGDTTEIAA